MMKVKLSVVLIIILCMAFTKQVQQKNQEVLDKYEGSHILRYNLNTKEWHDYGIMKPRYSTYSAIEVGSAREKLYAMVDPFAPQVKEPDGNHPFEMDLKTGVGAFDTLLKEIIKPVSLNIYETSKEQDFGREIFSKYVRKCMDSIADLRSKELNSLKNPDEWKARQKKTRDSLSRIFGKFPEKTPLNAKITGKLEYERYIIEKVIFESQPEYYVSANLYIPRNGKFPLPGVVFTSGHHKEAKANEEYQRACISLAEKGYVVLIFDPMGLGERSEYFNKETGENYIEKNIDQHHYVLRPSILVDWTLSGLRTWDGIRAIDYLVSRPEVDKNKLAAVGQSGGGQLASYLTAVDERIRVCVVSHPGGVCEGTFLNGDETIVEKDIQSLIAPRPYRIIVGDDSGEEFYRRSDLEDIRLFYKGLRADMGSSDLVVVPGIHSLNKYNREKVYEWLNRWFNKESEGTAELTNITEKEETLWCTESGHTLISHGGETGQTLNAKRMKQIYIPEKKSEILKERIALRIGLNASVNSHSLHTELVNTFISKGLSIEKLTFESEKDILIPTLLIKPRNLKPGSPVYIFVSEKGKPKRIDKSSMPFLLSSDGGIILAVDVRGVGETGPSHELGLNKFTGYTPILWEKDALSIQSTNFGRTTCGMRTLDVLRAIDLVVSRDDLRNRKIILVGEGAGGLWSLLASVFDTRVDAVITLGTLPSFKLLITNQYYDVWDYFWLPGVLCDFDIPDLALCLSPRPQLWIDPVNALNEKLNYKDAASIIGQDKNIQIITQDHKVSPDIQDIYKPVLNY